MVRCGGARQRRSSAPIRRRDRTSNAELMRHPLLGGAAGSLGGRRRLDLLHRRQYSAARVVGCSPAASSGRANTRGGVGAVTAAAILRIAACVGASSALVACPDGVPRVNMTRADGGSSSHSGTRRRRRRTQVRGTHVRHVSRLVSQALAPRRGIAQQHRQRLPRPHSALAQHPHLPLPPPSSSSFSYPYRLTSVFSSNSRKP